MRVLEIQAEIDYLYFAIDEWQRRAPKSGFEKLIDECSGHEQQRQVDLASLVAQVNERRKEYAQLTGEPYDSTASDELLAALKAESA